MKCLIYSFIYCNWRPYDPLKKIQVGICGLDGLDFLNVTLDHKTSLKSLGYICSNSQKYILWSKIIDFYFMPKIIRILSKAHVPWRFLNVNISKLNFCLVICIAKNFILNKNKLIYSAFRWCINLNFEKLTLNWFCGPGSQIWLWEGP